ncbi:MAG: inositol monophosphatase, partial [Verrucomicrobiota bacterium]
MEGLFQTIRLLHDDLQKKILSHRQTSSIERMSEVAAETKSDTIYQIDKVSEEAIFEWMKIHWPASEPVTLVMEGIEEGTVVFPEGSNPQSIRWVLIIDPIDGTRNLMFDKRSAWILTGLAPYQSSGNTLHDIVVALMTELPPIKQTLADQFSAIRRPPPAVGRSSA